MSNSVKTINPFTEQKLKEYTLMTHQEAVNAVEQSDKCFDQWKLVSVGNRAKLANELAKVIEDNRDELVTLMVDEMGKVKAQGEQEVALCANICNTISDKYVI